MTGLISFAGARVLPGRVVQRLVGLTRLRLITKVGLRPSSRSSSIRARRPGSSCRPLPPHRGGLQPLRGVDELQLVEEFMRKSARRRAA